MTTDERILDDLRRILGVVDDPPAAAIEAANAALSWRTIDAELAQLIHDSELEGSGVVLRGTTSDLRTLTFSASGITVDIEIGADTLMGTVSPPQACTVELHQPGAEPRSATADTLGLFTFEALGPGPVSLVCRADDGSWSVRTAWT